MNKLPLDKLYILSKQFVQEKISQGATVSDNYIKFKPHEKQKLLLNLEEDSVIKDQGVIECLYGGAAGGAKTVALLMAALKYVHVPNYSALLLRRNYPDLTQEGGLMSLAQNWLSGTNAKWDAENKTWHFPSGATLRFGYLASEQDKYRYQGGEYQFIGFDELTQFTETQYKYLFTRLRKKESLQVPLRIYSASNPGGLGGKWVYERFIPEDFTSSKAVESKVWYKSDDEIIRCFIPALLDDNPYIDKKSYIRSLSQLDEVTRLQYMKGEWNIHLRGDILYTYSEPHTVISWSQFRKVFGLSENRIPTNWKIGVFQDFGTTKDHPCVTSWFATAPQSSPIVNGVNLAGSVFLYRGLMVYPAIASNLAKQIKEIMGREISQTVFWYMSHEASSEREEYRRNHGLPFTNWKAGKTRGIEQLKNAFDLKDLDKPNPFKPELHGHPSLYLIVDDEEMVVPKTDKGLARWREEIVAYHWSAPKSGQPPMTLVPYALFNDAIDTMRAAAATYWPPSIEKTVEEKVFEKVDSQIPVTRIEKESDESYRSHLYLMRNLKIQVEMEKEKSEIPKSDWVDIG